MTARAFNLALCLALVGVLEACEGDILPPIPSFGTGGSGAGGGIVPDAGPGPCVPEAMVVPKLLRLSNFEYQNVVDDLLGVKVDPALYSQWTPIAVVYGFDTMSETRVDQQALEVQLATAENLASLVLATPKLLAHCPALPPVETPVCTSKPTYTAIDDFADTQGHECWSYLDSAGAMMSYDIMRNFWRKLPDDNTLLWRNGGHPGPATDAIRRWVAPVTGHVTLTGSFSDADPGGGDGVVVTILKNGAAIFTQTINNGGAPAAFNLPLDVAQSDRLEFVINRRADPAYDTTGFAAQLAFKPTPRTAAWTWSSCAEPLIVNLASRAFRRPVRPEELADYQALFAQNLTDASMAAMPEPATEAMSATLQAVFLSPSFVFKPELVPGGLDDHEKGYGVAARLALFTRASIADEPLWIAAGNGTLSDPAVVRAHAERLLYENVDRFSTHFAGQWLDYRELPPTLGPLTASMKDESRSMFAAVLSENLDPERLMTPGFTIVNPDLAAHYGLSTGGSGVKLRIATTERGGLLDQAGFLIRTASGSEFRRPIHRGLGVLTRMLCREMPRLDPATLAEINASLGTIDPTLPLPKRMEAHRNSATRCGYCHSQMDPVGLALEKYDPQGKWRETYAPGVPIETNLEFNHMVVKDPHQLSQAIETSPEFRACVAQKAFTFALNRGPAEGEKCVTDRLGNPLDGSKPTLKQITLDALMRALQLTEVKQ